MKTKIVSLMVLMVLAGSAAANVIIDDFESYGTTLDLRAAWVPTTSNVTETLLIEGGSDPNEAFGGDQCMKYYYNGGSSPYYSKVEYTLGEIGVGVDWTGYDGLTVQYHVTKSKDKPYIALFDIYGNKIYKTMFETGASTNWKQAVITFNVGDPNLTRVGKIHIGSDAQNYGTGQFFADDVVLVGVPEPATIAILGTGIGSLVLRKGKRKI